MPESLEGMIKPEADKNPIGPAAIRYMGEIFTSLFHAEALDKCRQKFPDLDYSNLEEGFMTTDGEFVDRDEAYRIEEEWRMSR